jgi:hypothetical protein
MHTEFLLENRNTIRVFARKPEEKYNFSYIIVDGRLKSKWILKN